MEDIVEPYPSILAVLGASCEKALRSSTEYGIFGRLRCSESLLFPRLHLKVYRLLVRTNQQSDNPRRD
jgi:hypothetical protein